MLYTIMRDDAIWQEDNAAPSLQMITYQGQQLIVSEQGNGKYQIERLVSTDPAVFMNPQFAPGSIIENPLIYQR